MARVIPRIVLPPFAMAQQAIDAKYAQLQGPGGLLGQSTTGLQICLDRVGFYTHYASGSIFWSPHTGAHEAHGAIRDKWASLGWERSPLGYPTSDEMDEPPSGRISHFEHGDIEWHLEDGAHVVATQPGITVHDKSHELGGWVQVSGRNFSGDRGVDIFFDGIPGRTAPLDAGHPIVTKPDGSFDLVSIDVRCVNHPSEGVTVRAVDRKTGLTATGLTYLFQC